MWIIYVISVLFCYAFVHVCLFMPCGHLLGKGSWPYDNVYKRRSVRHSVTGTLVCSFFLVKFQ